MSSFFTVTLERSVQSCQTPASKETCILRIFFCIGFRQHLGSSRSTWAEISGLPRLWSASFVCASCLHTSVVYCTPVCLVFESVWYSVFLLSMTMSLWWWYKSTWKPWFGLQYLFRILPMGWMVRICEFHSILLHLSVHSVPVLCVPLPLGRLSVSYLSSAVIVFLHILFWCLLGSFQHWCVKCAPRHDRQCRSVVDQDGQWPVFWNKDHPCMLSVCPSFPEQQTSRQSLLVHSAINHGSCAQKPFDKLVCLLLYI